MNNYDKNTYAFFDVDGTIINTKSVLSYLFYAKSVLNIDKKPAFKMYYKTLSDMFRKNIPREKINRFYYTIYSNISYMAIKHEGENWFNTVSKYKFFYNEETINTIKKHKESGNKIIFVSGSFLSVLDPLAKKLNCDDILCTKQIVVNGYLTGKIKGEPCIGRGKVSYINNYAKKHNIDLRKCYGYGDDPSDIPMLEATGYGNLITPNKIYTENEYLITKW